VCKFKPFNKHLLVEKIPQAKIPDLSPVLIPDDIKMKNEERYGLVKFVCAAADCEVFLKDLNPEQPTWATQHGTMDDVFTTSAKRSGNASLVVDQSMIEEIKIDKKIFNIVHQNYVVGVVDE
jgi:hypothetical protein|tara:strand:+ start:390 stop:755 length:366 start_codon:yes stop_codon:yes gene_type:complete